jgi:hypothetical protein
MGLFSSVKSLLGLKRGSLDKREEHLEKKYGLESGGAIR